MGGFGLPGFIKKYREKRQYLFVGVPMTRDTERMVLSDMMYAAGDPAGFALIQDPTDKERRFCQTRGIEIVEADIPELLAAAGFEAAFRAMASGVRVERLGEDVEVDGQRLDRCLGLAEVEARVARWAAIPRLRAALRPVLLAALARGPAVVEGRDVGTIRVRDAAGRDVAHDVLFAFAFHAFWPDGIWMLGDPGD